jgi:putative acetyltransferase
MEIKVDDLSSPQIAQLLAEHLEDMHATSPAESIHALDLSGLKADKITFFSAWIDGQLAGCGALKALGDGLGEIKSMRTSRNYLRQGVATAMLRHILEQAKHQSYRQISLETGAMDFFLPAHRLYRQFGFELCGPFGQYVEDSNSVFMTKTLN